MSPANFVRVLPGAVFQKEWAGRGAAFGDIDNNGDVDIVVSNVNQKAYVLRNDGGNRRNWLGIQTIGKKSNRDGIGCRVKVVSASGLAQYFTVQYGRRVPFGQRQAADRGSWRRFHCEGWSKSLALRRYPEIRER